MLFNSQLFLFAFLPVTWVVFWALRTRTERHAWLALTGYVFYATWDWRFCSLMALSTLASYGAGLGLLHAERPAVRRALLVAPITFDLAMLATFKYADFALSFAADVSRWAGHPVEVPQLGLLLPVGISFYTFHTITYVVDSYRRVVTPTRSLLEFACYVSFFAQLVAGPIVRFRQIEGDLEQLETARRGEWADRGWTLFIIGLVKKVLVADALAALINPTLDGDVPLGALQAWGCVLGYAYQLYFDFSGYSDMAMGLGLLFGLRLPTNFESPYQATDPSDFWRRWHISLSTMLRDYLYIPLGGNRRGSLRRQLNLLVTMLLGGLWHGANWTFVAWGVWHGGLLVAYRLVQRPFDALPRGVRQTMTFFLVVLGWTLFRARSLDHAGSLFSSMAGAHGAGTAPGAPLVAALAVAALVAHRFPRATQLANEPRRWHSPALAVGLSISMLVLFLGHSSPFLYFQF